MITRMVRVRLLGPREMLVETLRAVQDLGVLHLAPPPPAGPVVRVTLPPALARRRRQLLRMLDDVQATLVALGAVGRPPPKDGDVSHLPRWSRMAARARRQLEQLDQQRLALEEERALILKYQHLFSAFGSLIASAARWPNASAYHVLLKGTESGAIATLRDSLTAVIGDAFELYHQRVATGETALLVLVSSAAAPKVEQLLAEARVREIPVPPGYGATLGEAIPQMMQRLGAMPADLAAVEAQREALGRRVVDELTRARRVVGDCLAELDALPQSCASERAFVIEGWLPRAAHPTFLEALRRRFGDRVAVSVVEEAEWKAEDAPVVLHNPRLLRPFEAVIRLLPLPAYGTIDPTPFVAVFFPAFFGVMLGDVGYGLVLAALALVLRRVAKPESVLRAVAEIAGACAVFTVIGGLMFGELFGDLGRRAFGLHALAFDREEALVPFLMLAVALGAVHVLLGLILGAVAERAHPRKAIGRGVSALMILLVLLALLAVVGVLPRPFFTPFVIAVLVAFPVLIVAEGLIAPLELLSMLGNILSYARIMALGIASVMLAVVANRMVGAVGSVAVGVLFALLFHLVNFAIGLFSPTIHALRLHYVEFFGKFYSAGGVRYEPFRHWSG